MFTPRSWDEEREGGVEGRVETRQGPGRTGRGSGWEHTGYRCSQNSRKILGHWNSLRSIYITTKKCMRKILIIRSSRYPLARGMFYSLFLLLCGNFR
jgi:hypothetical protein